MAINNYSKKSIGELLCGGVLYVPEYQRDYAWEIKEEIDEFCMDLETCVNENCKDYFLGQIVVHKDSDNDKRYIIDGQQRICTSVIYLAVLRDILDKFGEEDDDARIIVEDIRIKYIGRWSNSRDTLLLHLSKNDDEFFRDNIQTRQPDEITKYGNISAAQTRMLEGYYYLYKFLCSKIELIENVHEKTDRLNRYYETFVNSFNVICVETNDMNEAFVIFETLNARGKDLATADLLKNYLFRMAGSKIEEVKDKWLKMIDTLDKLDATDYIRHFWNSQYPFVREKDLYKRIRDTLKDSISIVDFTNSLVKMARLYKSLRLADEEYYENKEINDLISNLKTMGTASFYPTIISMNLKGIKEDEQIKVFKQIETLFFRNLKIANESQSQYDRYFSEIARKIISDRTAISICEEIRNKTINDEQFEEKFVAFCVKSPSTAKYILREIGNHIQKEVIIADNRKIHLEHIMPKQIGDWEISETEHKANLYKLGNMTLLLGEYNRSISNKKFEEKKKMYENSEISITKKLTDYFEWNASTISQRQKELCEIAKERWCL